MAFDRCSRALVALLLVAGAPAAAAVEPAAAARGGRTTAREPGGASGAASASGSREPERRNRIIAVVNTEVITASDVAQAMAPLDGQSQTSDPSQTQERVITLLIEERFMLQEAKTTRQFEVGQGKWATPVPITVSEEEVADAIADAKGRFPSDAEFQRVLQHHGMMLKDLERRYRDQITIQKLIDREVRSRIVIAPSEITAYHQAHMDEYKSPEAVRVSSILIRVSNAMDEGRARAQANEVLAALKAGAGFAELARQHSEGPNAEGGGMIGWVERGRLMPAIEQVVFALDPGELSPAVRSALGYHIFRVEERRAPRTRPIADVQGEIRGALYQEKFRQRFTEWIGKLKQRAYIQVQGVG